MRCDNCNRQFNIDEMHVYREEGVVACRCGAIKFAKSKGGKGMPPMMVGRKANDPDMVITDARIRFEDGKGIVHHVLPQDLDALRERVARIETLGIIGAASMLGVIGGLAFFIWVII